jgi:hypothetical protein
LAVKRAILVPLLAGACIFATVYVLLPRPSVADHLALKVLSRLEQTRIAGSVIHFHGATVRARCVALPHHRELVSLGDDLRILVRATHVRALTPMRVLTSARRRGLLAAEADLAGPRALYVRELIGREATRDVVVRVIGRSPLTSMYLVRLSGAGPRVNLFVSRRTLRPVAVEYLSRTFSAQATLAAGRRGC